MTSGVPLYFLLLLLVGTLALTYFILQPFLTALILAAVFAVVLQPVYQQVLSGMPRWPSFASLLTVFLCVVCMLVPLGAIGTQIGLETAELYDSFAAGDAKQQLTNSLEMLERLIARHVPAASGLSENLSTDISKYAEWGLTWFVQNVGVAFSGVASFFLDFLVFFIALYYLLRDGSKLKKKIIELSPLRDTYDETVFDRLETAVNSVIRGNLSIALIQGILSAVGFSLFGVPNAALWGTVTAIAALIPGIGTGLVFIPVIIFMTLAGHTGAALGLVVWGVVAVGLIDNFLGPQLIGNGIKLHPLLVLLSVLGGMTFFGAIGLFLGPLAVSLLFALLAIYSDVSKLTR